MVADIYPFAQKLRQLDLSLIRQSLITSEEGPLWSEEHAETIERLYKLFLLLNFAYPNHVIIPSKEVDKFWHQHILDTTKYFTDCEMLFGYYLHHFPYRGEGGPDERLKLEADFQKTQALLHKHLEDLQAVLGWNISNEEGLSAAVCSKCGSACSKAPISLFPQTSRQFTS